MRGKHEKGRWYLTPEQKLTMLTYMEMHRDELFKTRAHLAPGEPAPNRQKAWAHMAVHLSGRGFPKTTGTILQKKVDRWQKKYKKAFSVSQLTGFGLSEVDVRKGRNMKDKLNAICSEYERCHSLWQECANVDPPALLELGLHDSPIVGKARVCSDEVDLFGMAESDEDDDDDVQEVLGMPSANVRRVISSAVTSSGDGKEKMYKLFGDPQSPKLQLADCELVSSPVFVPDTGKEPDEALTDATPIGTTYVTAEDSVGAVREKRLGSGSKIVTKQKKFKDGIVASSGKLVERNSVSLAQIMKEHLSQRAEQGLSNISMKAAILEEQRAKRKDEQLWRQRELEEKKEARIARAKLESIQHRAKRRSDMIIELVRLNKSTEEIKAILDLWEQAENRDFSFT